MELSATPDSLESSIDEEILKHDPNCYVFQTPLEKTNLKFRVFLTESDSDLKCMHENYPESVSLHLSQIDGELVHCAMVPQNPLQNSRTNLITDEGFHHQKRVHIHMLLNKLEIIPQMEMDIETVNFKLKEQKLKSCKKKGKKI